MWAMVWQGGANNSAETQNIPSLCAQWGRRGMKTGVKRIQCEAKVCSKAKTICAQGKKGQQLAEWRKYRVRIRDSLRVRIFKCQI